MVSLNVKEASQLEKAKLEDILVELLYQKYPDLVMHGGTAIWRCYSGNRFSRDIDMYYDAGPKTPSECYKEFRKFFVDSGFTMKSRNYDNNTETMHFIVEANTKMKIDINFRYKKGTPTEYTKVEGSKIIILSLTPEALMGEKIETYLAKMERKDETRQPEAQDLYDIYYLTTIIKNPSKTLKSDLSVLVTKIGKKAPVNMKTLGTVILSGIAPSFELMIKSIKDWMA